MDARSGGRFRQWRYRSIARPRPAGEDISEEFATRAQGALAGAGLPCCFGEMDFPHWRSVSPRDTRGVGGCAGNGPGARERALTRLILCSKCPVFDRCYKLTVARNSRAGEAAPSRKRKNLLAALARM